MALLKLQNVGPKLTKASIDALQASLGTELPPEYLAFLAKSNGGTATGYHFQLKGRRCYVNTFLSTQASKRGPGSMAELLLRCKGFIPSDCLPIAFADGENLVMLRTKAQRYGHVDLKIDVESSQEKPESGIIRLAKSFPEFLERLQYTDPSELDDDDYGMW